MRSHEYDRGHRGSQVPNPAELRRGEAAVWGPLSDTAEQPHKPKIRLISGRAVTKGSARCVCKVGVPIAGGELQIDGVMVCASNGSVWASLPSKPVLDHNGVHQTGPDGKKLYSPILLWSSKELRDRFSRAVVDLVRDQHADALGGEP